MRKSREEIIVEVMDVVSLVRGKKVKVPPLTLDMRICDDLHMDQDVDDLVLLLQKRIGIKPPKKDWAEARTIGDIVKIFLQSAPD